MSEKQDEPQTIVNADLGYTMGLAGVDGKTTLISIVNNGPHTLNVSLPPGQLPEIQVADDASRSVPTGFTVVDDDGDPLI